jgi:hypothetical protein
MGQNNVQIVSPHSPATFQFKLRNHTAKVNKYRFEVDTYSLPATKTCEPKKNNEKKQTGAQKLEELKKIHNRDLFKIPADWAVAYTPENPILEPEEEIDIVVHITPPNSFIGKMPFNINAYYNKNDFAGGVTLYVKKD